MEPKTIILTGEFRGREIRVEAKNFGQLAMSGKVFVATAGRTGSKTYAVNGDFQPESDIRGGIRRGMNVFTDEDGGRWVLGLTVVIRNRHGRICGTVESLDVTTVLPYHLAA